MSEVATALTTHNFDTQLKIVISYFAHASVATFAVLWSMFKFRFDKERVDTVLSKWSSRRWNTNTWGQGSYMYCYIVRTMWEILYQVVSMDRPGDYTNYTILERNSTRVQKRKMWREWRRVQKVKGVVEEREECLWKSDDIFKFMMKTRIINIEVKWAWWSNYVRIPASLFNQAGPKIRW